jgi:hypothetical protein
MDFYHVHDVWHPTSVAPLAPLVEPVRGIALCAMIGVVVGGGGMARLWTGFGAMVGGILYAVTGAVMAAANLGWFSLVRDANALAFWLGVGFALTVGGFAVQHGGDIQRRGRLGRWTARASLVAIVLLLLSLVIEFAIFGTLATFATILMFTVLVHQHRLLPRLDVVLLGVATVASITWNTETPSAALLIIVGLVAAWISYRALLAGKWGVRTATS